MIAKRYGKADKLQQFSENISNVNKKSALNLTKKTKQTKVKLKMRIKKKTALQSDEPEDQLTNHEKCVGVVVLIDISIYVSKKFYP